MNRDLDLKLDLENNAKNINLDQYTPKIGVFGLGGAGTNTVELLQKRLKDSVRFVICNTDVQSVKASTCKNKILLGPQTTRGKGAGGKPAVGRAAAEESINDIVECMDGLDMIILVAGFGGGTGTGTGQVVAHAAKERDILTIAMITTPFEFEGKMRDAVADRFIKELEDCVDTLVVSRNQKLLEMTKGRATLVEAFEISDRFSADCVESFVNIIQQTGTINVDFADIASIARDRKSRAIMGTGYAEGDGAGIKAVEDAMSSFLLEFGKFSWSDVDNVLLCVHGGSDLSMDDVNAIGEKVRTAVHEDSNIIVGANITQEQTNAVRVFIFGTTRRKSNYSSQAKNEASKKKLDSNYDSTKSQKKSYDQGNDTQDDRTDNTQNNSHRSFWSWGSRNDKNEKNQDIPEFLK